jgi:hypothetical protein
MFRALHIRYSHVAARFAGALTLFFAIMAVFGAASSPASAAVGCDRYASPSGSDGNSGTLASPYLTVQKLDNSLSAGQTGCLRAGIYASGVQTNFTTPNVTITSAPGERATVAGFPYITGAGDTFSNINFDLNKTGDAWAALCQGSTSRGASVTYPFEIEASNVTVEHSDVTVDPSIPLASRGLGIGVGFSFSTSGDVITDNRIHDVGYCPVEEHGIYLNHTSGVQVSGNWIYDIPAGTGIQVWDGPSNAHIFNNVIDGASSCIDVGGNTPITTGTMIEHNICSNMVGVQTPYATFCNSPGPGCTGPTVGAALFDYWGTGTAGAGNVMQNNLTFCASSASCTTSYSDTSGVTLSGNITANPQFADDNYQTTHNYQLASTSPAATWGLWNGDNTTALTAKPASKASKKPHRARASAASFRRLLRSRRERSSHRRVGHKHSRRHHVRHRERSSHRRVGHKHSRRHHVRHHR